VSWTKRQLVEQAFRKAGLAALVFDLTPDQLNSAMIDMDAMMGTWYAKGIQTGYPVPTSPQNADLDEVTGVADSVPEAIYLNLALRIAPDFGKMVMPETKTAAKLAYDALLIRAAQPIEMQLPGAMPAGAGNQRGGWNIDPFLQNPNTDPLQNADNGNLIFRG
jgi:hypothetical protein